MRWAAVMVIWVAVGVGSAFAAINLAPDAEGIVAVCAVLGAFAAAGTYFSSD